MRGLAVQLSPTRLPRELWILYAIAPLIATPVLSSEFFALDAGQMVRELAANYLAFLAIPLGIHQLYRFVMPAVIARCGRFATRLVAHLALTGAVTAAIALALHPVVDPLLDHGPGIATWLVRTVTVTWVVVVPALAIEELRARARAGERHLLAQRQAALRAQLEAIQSRTHPHFLFNSLNAVVSLIHDDPDLAERTLERLADVLRYALHSSRLDRVALRDELAMVEDYLEIQRARFGARLGFALDVEPGLAELRVPPLVLQPLVENAVLHGLASRAEGGHVQLVARRRGAALVVQVDDDGPGLGRSSHAGSGTGLRDLAERLALVFGDAAALAVRPNARGGVTAELVVPAVAP